MRGKKLLAMATALVFTVSSAVPAFAKESRVITTIEMSSQSSNSQQLTASISREKALEKAAQIFKDYFDFDMDTKKHQVYSELRKDYNLSSKTMWDIRIHINDMDKNGMYRVNMDANTGRIAQMDIHEYTHGPIDTTATLVTKAEAREIAQQFIDRVNAKEADQLKFSENNYELYYGYSSPINYNFRYIRQINGVPYESNGVSIEVNALTGKISSYNYNWDDLEFPSAQFTIDAEQAQDIIREDMDFSLAYMSIRDINDYSYGVKGVRLVYRPLFKNGPYVDANTGEMVAPTLPYFLSQENKQKDITEEQRQQLISKADIPQKLSKELDENQARVIIEDILAQMYTGEFQINQLSYSEGMDHWEAQGRKAWSAQFMSKARTMIMDHGGSISIDATNGQLISLYRYNDVNPYDDSEAVMTWEEGYDKAIDLIAKYYPQLLQEIKTEQRYSPNIYVINGKEIKDVRYSYNFYRMVNGIAYTDNYVGVSFDSRTGDLLDLRNSWDNTIEFPSAENMIDKEIVKEQLFDIFRADLNYIVFPIKMEDDTVKPEVRLVYSLKSDSVPFHIGGIDAHRGIIIDFRGNEFKGQVNDFDEKIKDHWAYKELSILAHQRIIDKQTFEVDKEITLREFVKMIVNARGFAPYLIREDGELKFTDITKDDKDYRHIQLAVYYELIENNSIELNLDRPVTREEGAEMLIKALGYGKLAQVTDIFVLPFKDGNEVRADRVGYVAVGRGLGIFQGNNDRFRPQDNLTTSELAVMLFRGFNQMRIQR